jgi:hypothetical protein
MRIGVDFDNTLADYDRIFGELALRAGYLDALPAGGKRAVRDCVRRLADGDRLWQRLQARAYGPEMDGARPFEGAGEALTRWSRAGAEVHIVSHKTRYASGGEGGVDLREAALRWLDRNGFFAVPGPGLAPERVHFNDTRDAKLARIRVLEFDAFVDDLHEVFAEPGFPVSVERVLFDPHGSACARDVDAHLRDWHEIAEHVLDRGR